MKPLREFLDKLEPLFTKGGRFEQFHALFEAVDTFLYSPGDVARGSPHIRDALDLKRVMITVVIAATPAAVMGMWNTGYQANMAMQGLGLEGLEGWRGALLALLVGGCTPSTRRFPLADPLWEDPDRNHLVQRPSRYYSGKLTDSLDKSLLRPLSRLFWFPLPFGLTRTMVAWPW